MTLDTCPYCGEPIARTARHLWECDATNQPSADRQRSAGPDRESGV